MQTKTVRLKPRDLQAIEFLESNQYEVKQWVQDNQDFAEIALDPKSGRLYLPTDKGMGMDIVQWGEFILFDPEGREFTSTTSEAYYGYYEEVGS